MADCAIVGAVSNVRDDAMANFANDGVDIIVGGRWNLDGDQRAGAQDPEYLEQFANCRPPKK